MGGGLSRGLGGVLHAGPRAHDPAPHRRQPARPGRPHGRPVVVVQGDDIVQGVHPLEGGGLRLKFRRDRRSGLPRETALRFYPRYIAETVRKVWGELSLYREWTRIRHEVTRDPNRWSYTNLAIAPPQEDELDALDLYH